VASISSNAWKKPTISIWKNPLEGSPKKDPAKISTSPEIKIIHISPKTKSMSVFPKITPPNNHQRKRHSCNTPTAKTSTPLT
jgi:hypothetical protein